MHMKREKKKSKPIDEPYMIWMRSLRPIRLLRKWKRNGTKEKHQSIRNVNANCGMCDSIFVSAFGFAYVNVIFFKHEMRF